jgi:hypothetical protein
MEFFFVEANDTHFGGISDRQGGLDNGNRKLDDVIKGLSPR